MFVLFKQKTAYEVRISDWCADVCSSDLLMRLAGADRAHDVDPRNDRAEVVRRPADEREDRIGREADDATATVEYLLVCGMAEPYPVFDLLLMPRQFNVGEDRKSTRLNSSH